MTASVSGPLRDAARRSLLEGQIIALREEIGRTRSEDVRGVLNEFLGRREADLSALPNPAR
jgi:hypothetical protein